MDGWPYAALLLEHAWRGDAVFLHIPKTGGSAVDDIDLFSGRERLAMLQPNLGKATRDDKCPCARQHVPSLCRSEQHHLTPLQLRACGLPADHDPYGMRPQEPQVHSLSKRLRYCGPAR